MHRNITEALIGTIVLAIAGCFLFFAYSSENKTIQNGYPLYATFDRIDGLNTGSDVKISGIKVGTVQTVDIDPKTFQAIIKMTIRSDIQLPSDSSAEVASESLMGGKYIAITPGGSDQILKKKESILYTQSSISFESLISKYLFSGNPSSNQKS